MQSLLRLDPRHLDRHGRSHISAALLAVDQVPWSEHSRDCVHASDCLYDSRFDGLPNQPSRQLQRVARPGQGALRLRVTGVERLPARSTLGLADRY